MSRRLILGLMIIFGLLVLGRVANAQEPDVSGDNSYCLVCHSQDGRTATRPDGTVVNLTVDANTLASSVHGDHLDTSLGCADCHGAQAFPHVEPFTPQLAEQGCINCHTEQAQEVSEGTHLGGSSVDFSDLSCLTCHGSHEVHPVTDMACQTCHGEDAASVESDLTVLDVSLETCEDCHAQTIHEWELSGHGGQQIACDTCHFPHQNRFRFETVQALCLNCHDQPRQDFTHVTHVGESCENCHFYREVNLASHVQTNGASQATGHDNQVTVEACLDCHSQTDLDTVEVASAEHPSFILQTRIENLEEEIETQRKEGATTAAVRLIQSAIVGIALGVVGAVIGRRYLSRYMNDGSSS